MRLPDLGGLERLRPEPSTALAILAVGVVAPLVGWSLAEESRLTLALLLMLAVTPIVLRWPVPTTVCVFAFAVPFDSVSLIAGAGGASVTRLIGMGTAAVLLASGLVEGRLTRPPVAALWWTAFMLWAAMSSIWALDPNVAFGRLPTAVSLFGLYLVAVCFRVSAPEFSWITVSAIAGATIAAAAGYFESAATPAARGTLRVGESTTDPNGFAAMLMLPLALAIASLATTRSRTGKVAAFAAIALIGLGILISSSRAGLLALLVMLLILLYRIRLGSPVVVAIVVLVAAVAVMPATFYDRVAAVFSGEDATGAGRTNIWAIGLAALPNYAVIGAGLENFTTVYARSTIGMKGAHNTFLGAWIELGVIGLALMVGAIASDMLAMVRTARSVGSTSRKVLYSLEAACYAILVCSFFTDRLWRKEFWLAWMLVTWAVRIAREPARTQAASPTETINPPA